MYNYVYCYIQLVCACIVRICIYIYTCRMSSAEVANFKLDKSLGGTSKVIHRKAIHRYEV